MERADYHVAKFGLAGDRASSSARLSKQAERTCTRRPGSFRPAVVSLAVIAIRGASTACRRDRDDTPLGRLAGRHTGDNVRPDRARIPARILRLL